MGEVPGWWWLANILRVDAMYYLVLLIMVIGLISVVCYFTNKG